MLVHAKREASLSDTGSSESMKSIYCCMGRIGGPFSSLMIALDDSASQADTSMSAD